MRVKPLEKSLSQPWQSHRYYLSRRKETRLAKNRVSVSIPYAFCEKPGFLGVQCRGGCRFWLPPETRLAKTGFQYQYLTLFLRKTRFLRSPRRGDVGFGSPRNPVGKKPGFLILRLGAECLFIQTYNLLLSLRGGVDASLTFGETVKPAVAIS